MSEPVPTFKINEFVLHAHSGNKMYILSIKTYCTCCDQFLKEPEYLVKDQTTISKPYWLTESMLCFEKGLDNV